MGTALKLGLADHGQRVTDEELESAEYESGYKYEVIDGRLYVSPEANAPENWIENWLYLKLWRYADKNPDVINYVSNKSRVYVPRARLTTVPEPDLSAYANFPTHLSIDEMNWRSTAPILVVEVLYSGDPYKDLVRNVDLFLRVPSIREYWIVDARDDADKPTLIVRRRRGKAWTVREYLYRETYTTKLLPGFKLVVDPRR